MKKEDNICYIQILEDELNEIMDIITELNNKTNIEEYTNEVLKMVFSSNKKSNKNEKEKLLDELTRDFGFDKENVDKIMKESPYLDLNDIISNLINDDKNEDDHPNEQDQGNINLAMNEKWEFGSGPSLFPAVPSPFLPPVNIFNPQFSGYGKMRRNIANG